MSLYRRLIKHVQETKDGVDKLILQKPLADYAKYSYEVGKSRGLQTALDILDNFLIKEEEHESRRDDD